MTSAEFIDMENLGPGAMIDVQTKNRRYRVAAQAEYCPEPVPGLLQGSANKQGVLEPGLIGRGMYLRFLLDDHRPVTTSRVLSVRVEKPPAPRLTSTIH